MQGMDVFLLLASVFIQFSQSKKVLRDENELRNQWPFHSLFLVYKSHQKRKNQMIVWGGIVYYISKVK